jgi:5-hydroxyisourate hydrolase
MAKLSTHVLDTHSGHPGVGMALCLERFDGTHWLTLKTDTTNGDGRTDAPLLESPALALGKYRLTFGVGQYFRSQGIALPEPTFLDDVPLQFGIADANSNYHVPLLCSPWSYSTYRGS